MPDFSNLKSQKTGFFIILIIFSLISSSICIYDMENMPNQIAEHNLKDQVDNPQTTVIYEQNISQLPRILQTINEFPVSTASNSTQYNNFVVLLGNNTFVVAYQSNTSNSSQWINAQILYANGTQFGSEIPININYHPKTTSGVSVLGNGNFIVFWVLD